MTAMTAVFCHIMQTCDINEAEFDWQIRFLTLKEEELSTSFQVKQISMVGGRPRLRDKLVTIEKDMKRKYIRKSDALGQ